MAQIITSADVDIFDADQPQPTKAERRAKHKRDKLSTRDVIDLKPPKVRKGFVCEETETETEESED